VVTRMLLKLGHPPGGAEALQDITVGAVRLERLFDAPMSHVGTCGAALTQHTWFVGEASSSSEFAADVRHPWDVAHEMSRSNLGRNGLLLLSGRSFLLRHQDPDSVTRTIRRALPI
jgi:hypothetical protein